MRLSRIFVKQPLSGGARLLLNSDDSHYLRNVLRLKTGAVVALFNGDDDCDYPSTLSYLGKQAIAVVQRKTALTTESNLSTEIIQGLSRSDHMDWMIQKATELGVKRLSIFNAQHTQIPLKSGPKDKKLGHWQAVAIRACEQCGRHHPPQINFYTSLSELIKDPLKRDVSILLNFEGADLQGFLVNRISSQQISLLLGPEGGLSDPEIDLALASGFDSVRLGPRVLRTETAAIAALAIVQSIWGDI
jgi:16S rRNA (uracil1498-N3)-methyltransferase